MTARQLWLCATLAALTAWLSPVAAHEHEGCEVCHKDPKLRLKYPELYTYYKEWTSSIHFDYEVGCTDCHGGDGKATEQDAAHGAAMSPDHPESLVHKKNLPMTCGACHKEVLEHFVTSKHYKKLKADEKAPHCATCHGSMNARVPIDIVDPTCETCHEEEEMPVIADKARSILYRLRIVRGYLGWTRLYFEEKGQPEKMKPLEARYQQIADAWHRFNLDDTDKASAALVSELEQVFGNAWREKNPGTLPP